MIAQAYIIIVLLVCTMGLFIWGKWRYDVVALMALSLAVVFKAVPFHTVYDGLSNPAVITVACVMILSNIVSQSLALQHLLQFVDRLASHQILYISSLALVTALLSSFMNNVGALAIMMPIAIQSARRSQISPALVLMPIALGSALGGLTTLIGTPPNLLLSSFREQAIGQPFNLFSFTKVGLPVAIAGLIYVGCISWRLIPKCLNNSRTGTLYEIKDYLAEVMVSPDSPLIGMTIEEQNHDQEHGIVIVGIIPAGTSGFLRDRQLTIHVGDTLIIQTSMSTLTTIGQALKLTWLQDANLTPYHSSEDELSLLEVVVTESSRIDGRRLADLQLPARFRTQLVAISRHGRIVTSALSSLVCRAGDVLLIYATDASLQDVLRRLKLLPLEQRDLNYISNKKANLGILFFLLAIIIAAIQLTPVVIAFSAAVLLCMACRVIPVRYYYENVNWSVIVLLAAMIPLGESLQSTGGTALITHAILHNSHHASPLISIMIIMIITMTLSDVINNAATAIVMAPIAINFSQALQFKPDAFLMAVAIGASCAFLTPIGHQNNTIIMEPGGYRFGDYARVGFLLQLIVLIVGAPMIVWLWPVH